VGLLAAVRQTTRSALVSGLRKSIPSGRWFIRRRGSVGNQGAALLHRQQAAGQHPSDAYTGKAVQKS